jgi:hypothetical protein
MNGEPIITNEATITNEPIITEETVIYGGTIIDDETVSDETVRDNSPATNKLLINDITTRRRGEGRDLWSALLISANLS